MTWHTGSAFNLAIVTPHLHIKEVAAREGRFSCKTPDLPLGWGHMCYMCCGQIKVCNPGTLHAWRACMENPGKE